MSKYLCQECHYLYDDAMEEVRFEDLPDSWECPVCGAPKSKYALKETDGTSTRTESEKMENLTRPAKSAVPVKAADELEVWMSDIREIAETGRSLDEAMRTRQKVISWDDILIKGRQLARLPLLQEENFPHGL